MSKPLGYITPAFLKKIRIMPPRFITYTSGMIRNQPHASATVPIFAEDRSAVKDDMLRRALHHLVEHANEYGHKGSPELIEEIRQELK